MPDREKVITLLDDMRLLADLRVHEIVSPDNWDVYSDLCDLIDLAKESALALLKEQDTVEHAISVLKAHGWQDGGEAVEPKPTGIEPNYNCGKCGLPIQQGYPFCPWCGKAVKWNA